MESKQEKKKIVKERQYIFTWNNPTVQIDWDKLNKKNLIKYAVWQKEVGEKTGTPHYQGYVELSRQARLAQMKKMIDCHWEERRGTRDQARNYAMKEDTRVEGPWEYGIWSEKGQGNRTDLDEVVDMANEGKTRQEIAKAHPKTFIRYNKGIDEYIKTAHDKGPRLHKTRVELYVGVPGTGKTHMAGEEGGQADAYWKTPDKWWDGYTQQDTVILDDFSGWIQWTQLLHIMDNKPTDVEVKGGKRGFNSKKLIITSNYHPKDWYSEENNRRPKPMAALMRRIDRIVIVTLKGKYEATDKSWRAREEWLNDKWHGGLDLNEGCDAKPPWEPEEEKESEDEIPEAEEGEEEEADRAAKRVKLT